MEGLMLAVGWGLAAWFFMSRRSLRRQLEGTKRGLAQMKHERNMARIAAEYAIKTLGIYRQMTRQDVPSSWRQALGFKAGEIVTEVEVAQAYRRLAKEKHPDRGGSVRAMAALNIAKDMALKELRG